MTETNDVDPFDKPSFAGPGPLKGDMTKPAGQLTNSAASAQSWLHVFLNVSVQYKILQLTVTELP